MRWLGWFGWLLVIGCADERVSARDSEVPVDDAASDGAASGDAARDAPLRPPCVEPGEHGECQLLGFEERPYAVWVPPGATSEALPLVLAFHGGGGDAMAGAMSTCPDGDLEDAGCLHSVGSREGFVTIYPNGTLNPARPGARIWNGGGGADGWACVGFCRDDIDESAYIAALLDDVSRWLRINPNRVYAAGLSNGGAVVHRLGCELSDRFAAIVTIGAGNQFATSATCDPSRAVGVLHIHGTEDGCWPYDGGPIVCANPSNTVPVVSVAESMRGWAERNGCGSEPVTADGPDRVDDDIRVEVDTWSGCAAPVRHLRVIGGGHTWLGGRQFLPESVIGPAYPDLVNEDIWSFFQENLR